MKSAVARPFMPCVERNLPYIELVTTETAS